MDAKRAKQSLAALDALLAECGVPYAAVIHGIVEQFDRSERPEGNDSLVPAVKELFGGMGSLNDIYISTRNGHRCPDERQANAQLDELREALWLAIQ